MFAKTIPLIVSVLLCTQATGVSFTPVEWDVQVLSGHCDKYDDSLITPVLSSLSEILSSKSHRSSLPKSCLEIKNSSPDSPSGYYTLLNATSGATSITYCDMDDLLFCASSLTSVLEKLQVATTGPPGPKTGEVVYTRWGRTSCPNTIGTQLLYQGRTGKARSDRGGGSNYQCLPNDPEYSTFVPGVQGDSYMYTVEYKDPINTYSNNYEVPCAVCHVSNREAVIVIPAKLTCPTNWTREYAGYLMSESKNSKVATFECVDATLEVIPGTANNTYGGLFYHVEANCDENSCPPYDAEKELTCIVCTH